MPRARAAFFLTEPDLQMTSIETPSGRDLRVERLGESPTGLLDVSTTWLGSACTVRCARWPSYLA